MEAKDTAFLSKLSQNMENKRKVEQMKIKEREMQYKLMQQKLEKKQLERQKSVPNQPEFRIRHNSQ